MTELDQVINQIAKKTAKLILPRVKSIVKEELENSFDSLITELKKQKRSENISETSSPNINSVKKQIATRTNKAKEIARNHLEKIYRNEFTVDDLINSAVDEQEIRAEQQLQELSKPLTDIREITEENIDPSAIDYSAMMKKLG